VRTEQAGRAAGQAEAGQAMRDEMAAGQTAAGQMMPGETTVAVARDRLVACGRVLLARGLLSQTSGNLSIRVSGGEICITPSSMEYDRIEPADIVVTGLDGTVRSGTRQPSSETPLHCLVYQSRPDVSAIVHTHSPHATTLAVLGLPIPAVHYMIAVTRTTRIEVAGYATYGTEALARNVRDAFGAPARAVLIANHGLVAAGATLQEAADVAEATETLAGLYYRALAIGKPNVLSQQQMAEVLAKYQEKAR
jgi:L-fuculose-phosphate aldolase